MKTVQCECEHISHFERNRRSPNGNPTHKYGRLYAESYMVSMDTEYGAFRVCKDCAEDCMHDFKAVTSIG